MFGIEQFVAVLNPPQAAILAVGATVDTPVARSGAVEIRPIMSMTLTVDYRAVDGAQGADFLRTVKQFVEDPALALCPRSRRASGTSYATSNAAATSTSASSASTRRSS